MANGESSGRAATQRRRTVTVYLKESEREVVEVVKEFGKVVSLGLMSQLDQQARWTPAQDDMMLLMAQLHVAKVKDEEVLGCVVEVRHLPDDDATFLGGSRVGKVVVASHLA